MLQLANFSLQAGHKRLLDHTSVTIKHGHKVGIIGANGSGKSTLFKAIMGEVIGDSGDLQLPGQTIIAHVKQETVDSPETAVDYVLNGDEKYRTLQQAIEQESDPIKQANYLVEFEHIDGYSAEARAEQLLTGLGFVQQQMQQSVSSFSGGWRMRLNLAQALMKPSNLLLLDEPTNHLDLDAVLWLESWLQRYQGTLLLISHDRAFLDSVCEDILHFDQQKLELYRGNYSDFENLYAQKLALQQNTREKQLKKAEHLQSFIDRFKAKATKAKQAQSRVKALNKLKIAEAVRVEASFQFKFFEPQKLPQPILAIEEAVLGYPQKDILSDVALTIKPGDRIGLLGRNGAGKSTLIKSIAGELEFKQGKINYSTNADIGYFAQHQLELLHADHSALQEMTLLAPKATEQQLRDYLGGFRFSGDRVEQKIALFSGGEKARLVLALLIWKKPNLLLLDEPTNHLDMDMREALTVALQNYSGAIVLVSHDRFLIEAVCDELILVAQGQARYFDGDLDEYAIWLKQAAKKSVDQTAAVSESQQQPASAANTDKSLEGDNKKQSRQQAAIKRQQLRPYKKKVDALEQDMEKVEQQVNAIEQELSDPDIYQGDHSDKIAQLNKEQNQLKLTMEQLESDYLEALEVLEQAESELD